MDRAHIFIADDDRAFLELMQGILQDEGYKVTLLQVPENAYEEIRLASPDLVVLDMNLQRADVSLDVLDLLKVNTYTTRTPVIVCTARMAIIRDLKDTLDDLGCYVLGKPFELDLLLSIVHDALVNPMRVVLT